MSKWELKDGEWIARDKHNTQEQPTDRSKDILEGNAPNYFIKTGTTEQRKKDNLRRFDKPSERQIRQLEKEDEEEVRKRTDITPVVHETKKDLESGKIRIHPGVLHNLNKKYYEKVNPHSSVTDEHGVTHILPQNVAASITQGAKSPEDLYEEMKKSFNEEHKVTASLGQTMPGNLTPQIEEKDLIEGAMQSVKVNRGKFRGRTIT
jgi:ribosomal protein L9